MPVVPLKEQLLRRKPIVFKSHLHSGEELPRTLTTFQLTMFGVGATVGTGVFFVLSESVPKAGAAVLISFVVAAIAAGLSALCYAELSSAIPVSGSTYSYSYHALGELAAVGVAACVLLEYGVSASAVAVGWSGYFNKLLQNLFGFELPTALSVSFVPGFDGEATGGIINLPAVVLVLMCMFLLLRGASESAKVNTIMVLIKVGVLILFSIIAMTAWEADHFANFFQYGAAGISAAAGAIFFSFIGLDAVATAGEEVKDPQRALPRAIIGALFIVTAIYLLVAIAGLAAKPVEWFDTPDAKNAGLAKILDDVTGSPIWSTVLAAGAVISIFSVTLVTLYGQTRVLFAIARDGMVPRRFLNVNPKTMTPTFNTIVVSIAGGLHRRLRARRTTCGTPVDRHRSPSPVVAISVIVLRRTHGHLDRPFKVPSYPLVPILTVVACAYILWGLHWSTWLIFGCWLVVVFTSTGSTAARQRSTTTTWTMMIGDAAAHIE
ncbi:MAG: amino acid permease [Micropruina sp.]